jgi:hypothetical protein
MSTPQLTEEVDELFDLVKKSEGIISTFEAQDLEDNPQTVEGEYKRYADTHVSLGDTGGFEENILEKVTESASPTKGYLYGPYGYGKTSTSVSIWNTLSGNSVIAVPPFTMDSFSSVMRAAYGWISFRLEAEAPGYVEPLEDIRERYLREEIRAVAEEKQDEHDLPADELVGVFQDLEASGELDLSIDSDTVIDFFDECTDLVTEAGFDGLVVIADEFQQYFKSADNRKEAEADFRQFVMDLQSGANIANEYGFFIAMPEQTKGRLDTEAEDVLNRLQNDNLTLNLRNVYDKDFPKDLWNRYADRFGFDDRKYDVISEFALDASGQICSRQDLSNGPRTVMDIFRIALRQYTASEETFTPLDLAEAFHEGEVRYQGSSTKIQTAIGDALDHSSVNSRKKRQFIKLCAVYPQEGVTEPVIEKYGLDAEQTALSKKLQGDVITFIAEGYTLVGVTEPSKDNDILKELIRDFWRQYDTDTINADLAIKAFADHILADEIFEPSKTLDGWGSHGNGFNQISSRFFRDTVQGTFDGRYPERDVSLIIADYGDEDEAVGAHNTLGSGFASSDVGFSFLLGWEHSGDERPSPAIRRESNREFTFVLDGRQRFDSLPNRLDFLRQAMNPKDVTPFLMLALVEYLEQDDTELEASQRDRVESFQEGLLNQTVKMLFDEDLIANAPFELRRAGKRSIEQVFSKAMEDLYPDYSTLMNSKRYESMMSDYVGFLQSLGTTSKRTGTEVVSGTKSEVVKRFGLKKNSTFDGRIKKHYQDLLKVENDVADNYQVRATLHPLEQAIVEELEQDNRDELPLEEVNRITYEAGYREEELEVLIDIMAVRGVVGMNDDGSALVLLETDVSPDDVEQRLDTAETLLDRIKSLDETRVPREVETALEELQTEFASTNEEDRERLEAIEHEASLLVSRLQDKAGVLQEKFDGDCETLQDRVKRQKRGVIPNHLDDEISGTVKFVGALNDAQDELYVEYEGLKEQYSEVESAIQTARARHNDGSIDSAEALQEVYNNKEKEIESIARREEELAEYADQLKQWQMLVDKAASVKDQIKDYARTFDQSIEEEDEIRTFIGKVSRQLADEPLERLLNREAFETELEQIEDSYKSKRKERRELFEEKRDQLDDLLYTATGGDAKRLRTNFDIQNPDTSRDNLVEDFKSQYRVKVIDEAEEQLEEAHREVEYAEIVGIDSGAGLSPDDVNERIRKAKTELQGVKATLTQFSFEDIGDQTSLDTNGKSLVETSGELNEQAKEFKTEQDPEEDEIEELLSRVQDNRGLDFKELLMEYHNDGKSVDPDELLSRIEQLFKLNQIDIRIQPRRKRR